MSLLIDAREACGTARTGKGQWARGFIHELARDKEQEITLLVEDHHYTDWVMGPNVSVRRFDRGMFWHFRVINAILKKELTGTYVSPTSFLVPFFMARRIPTVVIVHDMIAFRGGTHDRKATLIERMTLGRAVKYARVVCTISESTRQDLLDRYKSLALDKVIPIFAGSMASLPDQRFSDDRTILCVATLCPRKNQQRLIEAFLLLPEDLRAKHTLVLCGSRGWHDDHIVKLAQNTPGVEWKGHVNDEEYAHMLSTCHVFALPSLYEGFGMQILDALRLGVPTLTSDRGSLKEVAGEAAVIVDPLSIESIAKGLDKLLSDSKLRKHLAEEGPKQAKRFTWANTVALFMQAVNAL